MIRDVLLDIEGTTSSISFVHDVLFPYARERLADFVAGHRHLETVQAELERARRSLQASGSAAESESEVVSGLIRYIDEDVKDTALKALQGMIWKEGFATGAYRAHVYSEVAPALRRWHQAGLRLSIYSSGSIQAQKQFFGHTAAGDLLPLIHAHFDTTTGPKKSSDSYRAIAEALQQSPGGILFLSDVVAELDAAGEVGFQTCQLVRPGTTAGAVHPTAPDFDEVERRFNLVG